MTAALGLSPRLCTRCGARPRVPNQRWCGPCHLAYKRARRALRGETPKGNASAIGTASAAIPAPDQAVGVLSSTKSVSKKSPPPAELPSDPPAPYVPFEGLPPQPRPAWCDPYLRDLAERGLPSLAAAKAGIHRAAVRRYRDQDPEFDAEVDVALEYFRDFLEWESVTLGRVRHNPLPYFARLKAERPARYLDRAAVLVGSAPELTSEDGKALLAAMFGHVLPAPRAAIGQGGEALDGPHGAS